LTKHAPRSRQDSAPETGAGAGEITPAMIEAGVAEYLLHDRENDPANAIVCDVYQAMIEAAPQARREAPECHQLES
jgi:hypothetical protein